VAVLAAVDLRFLATIAVTDGVLALHMMHVGVLFIVILINLFVVEGEHLHLGMRVQVNLGVVGHVHLLELPPTLGVPEVEFHGLGLLTQEPLEPQVPLLVLDGLELGGLGGVLVDVQVHQSLLVLLHVLFGFGPLTLGLNDVQPVHLVLAGLFLGLLRLHNN